MKILHYPCTGQPAPAVVCVGVFDGVHLGHQAVIGRCIDLARDRSVASAVVTFDRDPELILLPEEKVPQVCTLDQKIRFIGELDPDYLLVLPFDEEMAALPARVFLELQLMKAFTPRVVVVGENFRFGAAGSGDLSVLRDFGGANAFSVEGLALKTIDGAPISSTRIRTLLEDGDVACATRLLGRHFEVEGTVVAGAGRGGALGYHTANVAVPAELAIPGNGVYAGVATLDDAQWPAAINVGTRPTFEVGGRIWVEVHIIGFVADLYGRHVRVSFLERLRDEAHFDDLEDLRRQVARDVEQARATVARLVEGT